ncbi:MAG: DUF1542 domain-containing protein [Clostridiales bacterium]|nr:DUF1542 domain-containing protein [Clostridiales bacterium]
MKSNLMTKKSILTAIVIAVLALCMVVSVALASSLQVATAAEEVFAEPIVSVDELPAEDNSGEYGIMPAALLINTESRLNAAIGDAEDGETVQIEGDIELTATVTINKSITLDLNGFTLTGVAGKDVITVTNTNADAINFTLTSSRGTGIISGGSTGVIANANANVVISNVDISCKSWGIYTNASYACDLTISKTSISCANGVYIYSKNINRVLTMTDCQISGGATGIQTASSYVTAELTRNTISGCTNTGVNAAGTVNMYDCTISNCTQYGINTTGTFTVYSSTISGCTKIGVNATGTVYMYSGTISGCGVGVSVKGAFYMSDGTITENTGNGVSVEGPFEMTNGTISNNGGRGVVITGNSITIRSTSNGMSGSNNRKWTTAPVIGEPTKCVLTNGNITGNIGGGVQLNSQVDFEMSGGVISGNGSSKVNGGGVYVSSTFFSKAAQYDPEYGNGSYSVTIPGGCAFGVASLNMSGGTISGNSANNGGGVYLDGGILNLNGGAISGNSATTNGGGVFAIGMTKTYSNVPYDNSKLDSAAGQGAKLNMANGTISGNTAMYGGGVYLTGRTDTYYYSFSQPAQYFGAGSAIDMSGGSITGNTALYGGGMYQASVTSSNSYSSATGRGSISLSGTPVVKGNGYGSVAENIYLISAMTLGEFSVGANIGVTYSSSNAFTIGTASDTEYVKYFHSDESKKCISLSGKNLVLQPHKLDPNTGLCTYCSENSSMPGHSGGSEHEYTYVPEIPATCKSAGIKAYYLCSICGGAFDENYIRIASLGSWLTTEGEGKIAKLPHTLSMTSITWGESIEDLTVSLKCSVCNEIIVLKHGDNGLAVQLDDSQEVTCDVAGYNDYTVTINYEEFTNTQQHRYDVAAIGHNYTGDWHEDGMGGHYQECENDPEHHSPLQPHKFGELDDENMYTCEECGFKTSHTEHKWQIKEDGWHWGDSIDELTVTIECSECHTTIELTDGNGLTASMKDSKNADCVNGGYSKYSVTVDYEGVSDTQEHTYTLNALGHDFNGVTPEWSWTFDGTRDSAKATATFKCNTCGHEIVYSGEQVQITRQEQSAASCEENSTAKYVASVTFAEDGNKQYFNDSEVYTEADTATGHSWGRWDSNDAQHWQVCDNDCGITYPVDHKWTETWNWGENEADLTRLTLTIHCDECGKDHVFNFAELNPQQGDRVEPSCKDGSVTYTATVEFGGQTFTQEHKYTIAATGKHAWELQGWTWAEDVSDVDKQHVYATFRCSACETEKTVYASEITDLYREAAKCEQDGKVKFQATVELDGQSYQDSSEEYVLAQTGHKWANDWQTDENSHWHICENAGCEERQSFTHEWTEKWTWGEKIEDLTLAIHCEECDKNVTFTKEQFNNVQDGEYVAPTCKEGSHSYTATVTYGDKTFTQEYTYILEAIGHDYEGVEPEWSWSFDGTTATATATFKCKYGCGEDIVYEGEQVRIERKQQTAATCEKDSTATFTATVTFAEDGDKVYTDNSKVYTEANTATGHKWSDWQSDENNHWHVCENAECEEKETFAHEWTETWTWGEQEEDKDNLTLAIHCDICNKDHVFNHGKLNIQEQTESRVEPSCNTGRAIYTASVQYGNNTFTSEHTYEIPATGVHNWELQSWNWPAAYADEIEVTATIRCSQCGKVETITAEVTEVVGSRENPKCEVTGKVSFTARATADNSQSFEAEAHAYVIPAKGHATLEKTDKVAPTCTKKGREAYWTCPDCDKHFKDEKGTQAVTNLADLDLDKVPHTVTKWEQDGANGHKGQCDVCAEQVTEQHSFVNGVCSACGYVDQKYLDDAKQQAKDELQKKADEAKKGQDNPGIVDRIEQDLAKAEEAIDKATTPEEVEQAKKAGEKAIDDAELNYTKDQAKKDLEQRGEEAKGEIDRMPGLTDEEKKAAQDEIDQKLEEANKTIDDARTVDDVKDVVDQTEKDIGGIVDDADEKSHENSEDGDKTPTLKEEKSAAKDALDDAANAKKDEINQRNDLTDEEKKDITDRIDQELDKAKGEVDKALNSEQVAKAVQDGLKNIEDAELNVAKDKAKEELEKKAQDAKDAIDSMPGLTDEEKQAAKDAIDEALKNAKKAVDDAETLEDVKKAEDEGMGSIVDVVDKADEATGGTLKDAKDKALEDLENSKKEAEDKIKKDPKLSDEEKEKRLGELEREYEDAKKKVEQAVTPEEAKQAAENGVNNMGSVVSDLSDGTNDFPIDFGVAAVSLSAQALLVLVAFLIIRRKTRLA